MDFNKIDTFDNLDDESPSLTLFLDQDNARVISQTWSRLELNISLKALHLISNFYNLPDDLSFLSRLESFSIVNYHGNINNVLKQLSSSCYKLYLDNFLSAVWDMETLALENSPLMCSVTHLILGKIGQSYCSFVDDTQNNLKNISRFVGERFSNLTYLDVRYTLEVRYFDYLLLILNSFNLLVQVSTV